MLGAAMQDAVRTLTGDAASYQYVPHFGYNSLFPLALQLVPWASADMQVQLRQLEDPQLLWTQFGLRSLAQTSSIYRRHNTAHDAPYWRGAIWVNMNFLVLRSLRACSRWACAVAAAVGFYQDNGFEQSPHVHNKSARL